jgi:hypothetical protein
MQHGFAKNLHQARIAERVDKGRRKALLAGEFEKGKPFVPPYLYDQKPKKKQVNRYVHYSHGDFA